jgi:hypothetical protein
MSSCRNRKKSEMGGDSLPLTHLKREHFPPEDARSCGILENKNGAADLEQLSVGIAGIDLSEEDRERTGNKKAPLLDPTGGVARRAAKRLGVGVRLVVVPRSGGRSRRVLHHVRVFSRSSSSCGARSRSGGGPGITAVRRRRRLARISKQDDQCQTRMFEVRCSIH